jgi:hypothetical protein
MSFKINDTAKDCVFVIGPEMPTTNSEDGAVLYAIKFIQNKIVGVERPLLHM